MDTSWLCGKDILEALYMERGEERTRATVGGPGMEDPAVMGRTLASGMVPMSRESVV